MAFDSINTLPKSRLARLTTLRNTSLAIGASGMIVGLYLLAPWIMPQPAHAAPAGVGLPRHIWLPDIGADGPIVAVALEPDQRIAAPKDIGTAGWYVNSAKPGEPGLSIIDGHVDGMYKHGIFHHLSKLNAGENFMIEYDAGEMRDFKIVSIKTVGTAEATAALFARDSHIVSQLNLITCAGSFKDETQQYDKRIIVVAEGLAHE